MKSLPVVAAALLAASTAAAPSPNPTVAAGPAPAHGCALRAPDGPSKDIQTAVRPFDASAPGALSVDQMSAAWTHEVARFFPELGGGG